MHRPGVLPSLVAEPDAPIELDRLRDSLPLSAVKSAAGITFPDYPLFCMLQLCDSPRSPTKPAGRCSFHPRRRGEAAWLCTGISLALCAVAPLGGRRRGRSIQIGLE